MCQETLEEGMFQCQMCSGRFHVLGAGDPVTLFVISIKIRLSVD